MDTRQKLQKVKAFLGRQDFVRAAYLFGSHAEGRSGPLSDMDFAVFLDGSLGKKEMREKRLFLVNSFSGLLGTDNFDLVVMNGARLLMNFNIIKNGIVLKSGSERASIEAHIMCDYLDRKYYDDMHARLTLERIGKVGIL
jgi:predicted nucleotidyltransferase